MVECLKLVPTFLRNDYVILYENESKPSNLHKFVKSELPKKTFLIKNDHSYLIEFTENKDKVLHTACQVAFLNDDINEVVNKLNKSEVLLVKNDKNNYVGFVTIQHLLCKLLSEYEHLNAYVHTILDTIEESCTVIDQNKNVIFWTKGAEDIFSINREEIIGKPITDYFESDQLEILNALKNGVSVYRNQHKAKDNLVVMINSSPVYLNDKIIGAVVSETDITSQIILNNELYNASDRLFHLEKEINRDDPFKEIRGRSPNLKETVNKIKKLSDIDTNILIHGESGVGKELFAKAVHNVREKKDAPFVAINCGAIPSALFESEIFGYEKGAFSGAHQKGKKGKVELARNGTLFLDEIGEMPLDMQVKILRLLQEKRFFPVGGTKEIEVDFRVVAATNRDLKQMVKEGKFREDLYYRLNVVSIEIPPLRKRPEDIIELTHYFLYEISIKYNRPIHGISQDLMQALLRHDWPGNIRELKNVIERLVVFSEDGEIKLDDLPFEIGEINKSKNDKQGFSPISTLLNEDYSLKEQLEEFEKEIIIKELQRVNGNKQLCAKNLKVTRATLYNRMNRLGIEL